MYKSDSLFDNSSWQIALYQQETPAPVIMIGAGVDRSFHHIDNPRLA